MKLLQTFPEYYTQIWTEHNATFSHNHQPVDYDSDTSTRKKDLINKTLQAAEKLHEMHPKLPRTRVILDDSDDYDSDEETDDTYYWLREYDFLHCIINNHHSIFKFLVRQSYVIEGLYDLVLGEAYLKAICQADNVQFLRDIKRLGIKLPTIHMRPNPFKSTFTDNLIKHQSYRIIELLTSWGYVFVGSVDVIIENIVESDEYRVFKQLFRHDPHESGPIRDFHTKMISVRSNGPEVLTNIVKLFGDTRMRYIRYLIEDKGISADGLILSAIDSCKYSYDLVEYLVKDQKYKLRSKYLRDSTTGKRSKEQYVELCKLAISEKCRLDDEFLTFAVECGDLSLMKLVHKKVPGLTVPFKAAIKGGDAEVLTYVFDNDLIVDFFMPPTAKKEYFKNFEIVKYLYHHHLDVFCGNMKPTVLLQEILETACKTRNMEMFLYFNTFTEPGRYCVRIAIREQSMQFVKLFCEKGILKPGMIDSSDLMKLAKDGSPILGYLVETGIVGVTNSMLEGVIQADHSDILSSILVVHRDIPFQWAMKTAKYYKSYKSIKVLNLWNV